jgi:hypothetical protein
VNSLATSGLYQWTLNNNPNTVSGTTQIYNGSVTKADEGWYHLTVSHPDCAFIQDSVFIPVLNRPEISPCKPAVNTATFSNMPSAQFLSVTYGRDPDFGTRSIGGYYANGYPDLKIHFNHYWDAKEPEDGAYSVSHFTSLTEFNPYSVHMQVKYGDILFSATTGKAYVSHTNGKITVTFCGVDFSGSYSGTAFKSNGTGSISAP